MIPANINHVIFNTGRCEHISASHLRFPPHERIGLEWLIKQAKELEGTDVDENIILKICNIDTCRYTAAFSYGTYAASEMFLVSTGAKTDAAMDRLWDRLCNNFAPNHQISTPLGCRPAGPMVMDILLPCSNPAAMAYLHSTDCYELCLKLGWALLYPESLKI